MDDFRGLSPSPQPPVSYRLWPGVGGCVRRAAILGRSAALAGERRDVRGLRFVDPGIPSGGGYRGGTIEVSVSCCGGGEEGGGDVHDRAVFARSVG